MKTHYRFEELPGSSPLHAAMARSDSQVARWVRVAGEKQELLVSQAREMSRRESSVPETIRELLLKANAGAGVSAAGKRYLARIRKGRFFVVGGITSGALFGGPMRVLYKALTAAKVAEYLEALGVEAVPLICIDESTESDPSCVLDQQNEAHLLPGQYGNRSPEHAGAGLLGLSAEAIDWMRQQLPSTAFTDKILGQLTDAYSRSEIGTGLAGLLAEWLVDSGVLVLPISKSGFSLPMVDVRNALEGIVAVRQSEVGEIRSQLQRSGIADAASLSTVDEALRDRHSQVRQLLPLALLPWLARICIPAEVAVHACLRPLLQSCMFDDPILLPSASMTIVEPRVGKFLEKYGLELEDFFLGEQHVHDKCGIRLGGLRLNKHFEDAETRIGELLASMARVLEGQDPLTKKVIDGMREKVLYQLLNLKNKQEQSWLRQQDIARQQVEKALHYLLPLGRRQEEIMNVNYFLVRHGQEFIHAVCRKIEPFTHGHRLYPYAS
jgi:uncharacterized protein YllA (UPF0747 family)